MKLNPIGPNQTEIDTGKMLVLFSYKTPVAAMTNGGVYRTEEKHSNTTSRHINAWLDGRNAEVKPQAWFDALLA